MDRHDRPAIDCDSASTGILVKVASAVSRTSPFRSFEQQDEDAQLFVRTRRQSRPVRQQTHVTRHLAAFEELVQRGSGNHGATRCL